MADEANPKNGEELVIKIYQLKNTGMGNSMTIILTR
jgi:hypothetical protein